MDTRVGYMLGCITAAPYLLTLLTTNPGTDDLCYPRIRLDAIITSKAIVALQ